MTKATIAGGAFVAALALIVLLIVVRYPAPEQGHESVAEAAPAPTPSGPPTEQPGFLYGRITTIDGATYEGRIRWGRDQEAFWGDYFNGTRARPRWAMYRSLAQRPVESKGVEIFGVKIGSRDRSNDLDTSFMTRFGDIARIEAHVRNVQVTLKSGAIFDLNRNAAGDIDDGVRVWDGKGGFVDLDARRISAIDFLPTVPLVAPSRLRGTVRTRQGSYTGFILWDAQESVGSDTLDGRTADGERKLPYETIRSIARESRDSGRVTLLDGRELVLSGTRDVDQRNRGIYVEDPRYGRVRISWDAFERVDFTPGGSGPAYGDFVKGRRLTGNVTTRDGRRLGGRLVFDVDETETTDPLNASSAGVTYTIPFSLIASIASNGGDGRATVTLHDGETLQLDRTGDLGDGNAGMLIFADGREGPDYVAWADVERVDFDHESGGD